MSDLCRYCFQPIVWQEKVCLGCMSQNIRCRKLILGRDIARGCRCARSWCNLDLTFDHAVVTLTF